MVKIRWLLLGIFFYSGRLFSDVITTENNDIQHENPNSDLHGFLNIEFKNDYMTPRGLLVTDTGLTIQIIGGFALDVYKNPDRDFHTVTFNIGVWNDLWTNQHNPYVGSWNEMDWFLGMTFLYKKSWKFQAQFLEFLSPPHIFKPENNAEFTLSYDDSEWKNWITINPYIKLFWAISGDSTIVVGNPGNTYYIEIGMSPTYVFSDCALPVTLTFPTWLSFGPANFWNGGKLALKRVKSHFGVFSIGPKAIIPLEFIPKRLGTWSVDLGIQYYYLINDNLLQAQLYTIEVPNIKKSHRNVGVGYLGLGFTF